MFTGSPDDFFRYSSIEMLYFHYHQVQKHSHGDKGTIGRSTPSQISTPWQYFGNNKAIQLVLVLDLSSSLAVKRVVCVLTFSCEI